MEDNPNFFLQTKDDLNILVNGRQPPKITIAILFFANSKIMYTDFQLGVWPGTGRKISGGGWVGGNIGF